MATLQDVFGVLAPPAGAHGVCEGIFGFLTTRDARALRLVCRLCCADVAAARWHDEKTAISGSLAAWRTCFPDARAANVVGRVDLRDADFARLAGLKGIMAAKKKTIDETKPVDVESSVKVLKVELPAARKAGRIVGEGAAAVPALMDALRNEAKVL